MKRFQVVIPVVLFLMATVSTLAMAAYQHSGDSEKDAKVFLNVYPGKAGTKLDNCALCHGGGQFTDPKTSKTSTMGSCQYCHAVTSYGTVPAQYAATLNPFGKQYLDNGRNEAALLAIETADSDGDGYSNIAEINATRYPGDAKDDPTKVVAPFRIFTKAQLQAMPQHSQFMLMNTTKSGDYYAEYSGVIMQDLLKKAGILPAATRITVFAPDGYSISHPLIDDSANIGASYAPYVNGIYPPATYYYDTTADKKNGGWCDYSSPGNMGRSNGDPIDVPGDLRLILALQANGADLAPGYLDNTNKLASGTEGPFRTVTPQKIVGPPDQASSSKVQNVIWPYKQDADHNAGFSSKSATIIKVEPLPEGTTDIDVLEAGWNYVDSGKIVVYGNVDPMPNIMDKFAELTAAIRNADKDAFSHRGYRMVLIARIDEARRLIAHRHVKAALRILQHDILPKTDSCGQTGSGHCRDWLSDCDLQQKIYWTLQDIITLLGIVS